MNKNKIKFKGYYINGIRWNGKGYDENGNISYELKNGDGKVKEYNDNGELLFEGEYLNGLRNGKGKDYFFGKLIFEGEYLNGERNGKGKEFDDRGYLIFEGEYLNGIKWNGNGYHYDKIIYQIKDGKGYFKEYKYDKLVFEGEYINNVIKGKEYYNNKLVFEGEYLNNKKWNGKGYDSNNNTIYELKDGKGYIKEYSFVYNQIVFEGEYLNGERNGKGKEYNDLGYLIYEG